MMGYFLDNKIPDYNPLWEEEAYQDMPDYWKWYHLGYQDGEFLSFEYKERAEKAEQELEGLRALCSANHRVQGEEYEQFVKEFVKKYETSSK